MAIDFDAKESAETRVFPFKQNLTTYFMLIGNQQLSTQSSHLQKYIHERVLHVINGLGLCLWMVMMYLFGENYLVITIAIGMHLLLEMY